MTDKTLEAVADYIKEGYISGDAKEIIAEIIATHDSELKKQKTELLDVAKDAQIEISYIIKHLSDQQPRDTIPIAWLNLESKLNKVIYEASEFVNSDTENKEDCFDCDKGYCTMNCSPRIGKIS